MGIYAQKEVPDFEFKLYITNPDGDKDSLCLGDVLREKLDLDTAYGEYDISHIPFKSTIDIRSMLSLELDYHFKKFITRYNCDSMALLLSPPGYPSRIPIGFYSRSYPVTLSWASEKFLLDTCRDSSFITRINYASFDFSDERNLPKLEARLSRTDQLVLERDYLEQTNYAAWARRNYYETKLDNGDSGVIYMIHIGITNQALRILIDTKNPQKKSGINVYPNPAVNSINLTFSVERSGEILLEVFAMDGQTVFHKTVSPSESTIEIDLKSFSAGLFMYSLTDQKGKKARWKFLKAY